ncbi:MAG TPA: OmpA family protein [bacterium]|nr:OmpA family protein [bacterium]HPN42324.1 OmpA family protein [bacterium]
MLKGKKELNTKNNNLFLRLDAIGLLILISMVISGCASSAQKKANFYYVKAQQLEMENADPLTILATLEIAKRHNPELKGLNEKIAYYEQHVLNKNTISTQQRKFAEKLEEPINTIYSEGFPVISPDGSMMIFTSDRPGSINNSEDFWMCRQINGKWTVVTNLGPNINTSNNDGAATITPDFREIFFSRVTEYGGLDIFQAEMQGLDWSAPKSINIINSSGWDSHPSISADGKQLFFSSNRRDGYGNRDIWMANRDKNMNWISVENLGTVINSKYDEITPFLHYDGVTLYFSSDKPGGCGGYDVYMSQKINGKWTEPKNLGPYINNSGNDYQYTIDFKGENAYFARKSDTPTDQSVNLYKIEVPDSLKPSWTAFVKGSITDAKTGNPVLADIILTDLRDSQALVNTKTSIINGEYLVVLQIGKIYNLQISSPEYIKYEESFDLRKTLPLQNLSKNVQLYPAIKKMIIKGIAFDYYIQKPLGGVAISVESKTTGKIVAVVYTNYETGQYIAEVPADDEYRLSASCEGFWPDWFENPLKESGEATETIVEWSFHLKLFTKTVEEKIAYGVNTIYFETNATDLKNESFSVLDRLFQDVLQKYPEYGFKIMGHTDNIGTDEYNSVLSANRAKVVKDYWINKGIPVYRLISEGYGESKPVATNDTEEGRQLNRRTELLAVPLAELYK